MKTRTCFVAISLSCAALLFGSGDLAAQQRVRSFDGVENTREPRFERRELVHVRNLDRKDRRAEWHEEKRRDKQALKRDRLEGKMSKKENKSDRREDKRDRKEDRRDRRENRRDGRF